MARYFPSEHEEDVRARAKAVAQDLKKAPSVKQARRLIEELEAEEREAELEAAAGLVVSEYGALCRSQGKP